VSDWVLLSNEQREAFCELLHLALSQMRSLEPEQARALADAFHDVPIHIYNGRLSDSRTLVASYQLRYEGYPGIDYLAAFDRILSLNQQSHSKTT
jgi:hypothetical protein